MNLKNKQLEDAFDKFISSSNLKEIISAFNQLCDVVDLNPAENSSTFYKLLRNKCQGYWKANSLFSKLDKKVLQKEYRNQTACSKLKTLVIGAGPCGIRCAIEFALLGARVVVLEKRNSFSRNNVLHLWPFVIHDLNILGAKKFYGLFCSGSINHISIRRLQCILLKIALLFGVQVFIGVAFQELVPPVDEVIDRGVVTGKGDTDNIVQSSKSFGWRCKVTPDDCILSNYEFDAIVGADGKANILEFKHKELRCRLAIAITANFINNNTPEEAQVEEISGVAFIFNQQFFKDLYKKTGIDLENIVYYKDETHYYVMTAKKHSLLSKGVLYQDYDDPETLLRPDNINLEALQNYAKEAANVATNNQLTNLQFSLNHRGEPDVALFDFTHMFAAENASMIIERNERPLVKMLVGDSLLEPFWPTGSGCALGFLSALDAAWLVRRIGMINSAISNNKITKSQHSILVLEAIAERESVYQRLSQTNASNMPTNLDAYTIDPRTRYTQCKLNCIEIQQIVHLYDAGDPVKILPLASKSTNRQCQFNALPSPKFIGLNTSFNFSLKDISISQEDGAEGSILKSEQILRWFQIRLDRYTHSKMFRIDDLNKSWSSGVPFLCLIHLYRPDLVDLASVNSENKYQNLEKAFMIFEKEFKIRSTLSITDDWENQDPVKMVFYLEKIYATFQSLVPIRSDENVEPRILEIRQMKRRPVITANANSSFADKFHVINHIAKQSRKSIGSRLRVTDIEKGIIRQRKDEIIQQYEPKEHIPIKKPHSRINVAALSEKLFTPTQLSKSHKDAKIKTVDKNGTRLQRHNENQIGPIKTCHFCKKKIIHTEQGKYQDIVFHKQCFRCQYCDKVLTMGQFRLLENLNKSDGNFYCLLHYQQMKQSLSKIKSNQIKGAQKARLERDDVDGISKFKKPKYSIKDFGELSDHTKSHMLPVNRLFNTLTNIVNDDLQRNLSKAFLDLRRINDESDEDYDGSVDESYDDGTLLDTVEPIDDDQLCWPAGGYLRYDIEYGIRKCSVIKRNRLIYKKYISKDDSTSDESELNYDFTDNCRTSDEDFLDDINIFGKPQDIDISRSVSTSKDDVVVVQQNIQMTDIDNHNCLPAQSVDNNISCVSPNTESKEQIIAVKEMEKLPPEENIDSSTAAVIETNSQKENSKSLRQLAKLKFCTEPPKPVSINSKEFIGQMNREKLQIIDIPFCFGSAERIPALANSFIKINDNAVIKDFIAKPLERVILSATIIRTSEFSPEPSENKSAPVYHQQSSVTLATDDFDDVPSRQATKKRHSLTNNIFNEICDIKDIDSLSINTEDSSMTQTDLISENDIFKNYVPLLKMKSHQKASLDSELDASLGISSIADVAFAVKSSSNDSINSLDNCSSGHSSNKSDASDVLASNEDENKDESSFGNKFVGNTQSHESSNQEGSVSNTYRLPVRKEPKKSKTKRFKQMFVLKPNKIIRRHSMKEEQQSCPVIDEASPMDLIPKELDQGIYESVTPPHDILLDDQVQSYELKSQCQFVCDSAMVISCLDNASKQQRVCDMHKQLEDIGDRLRILETKSVDTSVDPLIVSNVTIDSTAVCTDNVANNPT